MKNIILITGILSIITNTLIGLILSNYPSFNCMSVNIILFVNGVILYLLTTDTQISNGFKISLSFLFPVLGFVSMLLAIKSPPYFTDNYYLIGFVFLLFVESVIYIVVRKISSMNLK